MNESTSLWERIYKAAFGDPWFLVKLLENTELFPKIDYPNDWREECLKQAAVVVDMEFFEDQMDFWFERIMQVDEETYDARTVSEWIEDLFAYLKDQPKSVDVHCLLGLCCSLEGSLSVAMEFFQLALVYEKEEEGIEWTEELSRSLIWIEEIQHEMNMMQLEDDPLLEQESSRQIAFDEFDEDEDGFLNFQELSDYFSEMHSNYQLDSSKYKQIIDRYSDGNLKRGIEKEGFVKFMEHFSEEARKNSSK